MKIFVFSRQQLYKRNWGRELFKIDLAKQNDVSFFGKGYQKTKIFHIPTILSNQKTTPDFLFSSVFAYASSFTGYELIKKFPKIHYEVDYVLPKNKYTGTIHVQNPFYYKAKYDLIFGVTKRMVMDMKNNNVSKKIHWLPFSVSTDKYKNLNLKKEIDLMAVFLVKDILYPNRSKLQNFIKTLPCKTFSQYVIHDEYIKKINQSKIFITSNNVYNSLNMKYTEVLACGTLLMANRPEDFDDIGFKDGEHLILYKDFNDLKDKINYFLKNDSEREGIAKNGMNFVRKHHSNEVRIKEMTDIIKKELF